MMSGKETFIKAWSVCFLTLIFIVINSTSARGVVIRIPGDFSTIQAGIDAAMPGDTVTISDGTYTGTGNKDLDFNGKAITVTSENGPENCVIDCEGDGRGFYFHNGETSSSILSGITITNGNADFGGGIRCTSSPTITSCKIIGNTAQNSGGGIFFAVWTCTVTNSVIAGNTATWGGAIYSSNAKPRLVNCTMIGNTGTGAVGISSSGSGVVPTISNCILWEEPSIFYYSGFPYPVDINHCDLKSTEIEGATIIHSNPLFTDVSGTFPIEWDLHLLPSSPCIDTGNNNAPSIPTNDFEGDQRIIDGDENGTATVDMGVDEYQDITQTTVNGTLILPEEAVNKEYVVIVDNDTESDNGWAAATVGTCGSGTTVDYSITNVPAGTYYVYAVVRIVSAHDSPAEDGDYIGFYGSGEAPPDNANAIVPDSGTVTFDITVSIGANVVTAKTLYDDFSATYLDSSKWNQGEFVREIANEKLVMKIRNSTIDEYGRATSPFQNPLSITTIQCDISVTKADLDTGTNPSSFGRIHGFFYNTQSSGGATGDIFAGVSIGDRGNGIEAWWEVHEGDDDELNDFTEKGIGSLSVPGLTYGNSYTVKLEYDGDKSFTFTAGGVSASFTSGPDRQRDAVTQHKALRTGAYADGGGGSGSGYASATFDNVLTNGTPYDDFSSSLLDQTKWQNLEFVRELSNGKLRLNVQAEGSREDATLRPINQDTAYLEAKVLIESGSQMSLGAHGRARLAGWYYNDSRGQGSGQDYNGYEGNVWVINRIYIDDNANLTAKCRVWRCETADPWDGVAPSIFDQDFTTPIDFDTAYTLSIEYTGSAFIFKCNNETYQYDITTPTYPPYNGQERELKSRVYADIGESGYIKATFDDVYVEGTDSDDSGGGGGGDGDGCFIETLRNLF